MCVDVADVEYEEVIETTDVGSSGVGVVISVAGKDMVNPGGVFVWNFVALKRGEIGFFGDRATGELAFTSEFDLVSSKSGSNFDEEPTGTFPAKILSTLFSPLSDISWLTFAMEISSASTLWSPLAFSPRALWRLGRGLTYVSSASSPKESRLCLFSDRENGLGGT